MKKIFKLLFNVSIVTAFALLYVALQVEIYRVSYSIHKKERTLSQIQDNFERVKMCVSKLKSLDSLEEKVQVANIDLALPSEVKTIHVVSPENIVNKIPIESPRFPFSLLQFVKEAHAKIISSDKD